MSDEYLGLYDELLTWYNTLEELRNRRNNCGFFDFSTKRELDEQIKTANVEINVLRAKLNLPLD